MPVRMPASIRWVRLIGREIRDEESAAPGHTSSIGAMAGPSGAIVASE